LLRAAEAEREELRHQRARLDADRTATLARLREIERVLAEVDERERLLDQLAPAAIADSRSMSNSDATAGAMAAATPMDRVLRGPSIRETAVRVLVGRGGLEALHYREWFDLLTKEGYSVAGKNGLAVFLTQISRSPAVRKGTQSGIYELDRDAPRRLARELERLQAKLRELTGRTPGTTDLSEIRARREQLASAIGQAERALEEAQPRFRCGSRRRGCGGRADGRRGLKPADIGSPGASGGSLVRLRGAGDVARLAQPLLRSLGALRPIVAPPKRLCRVSSPPLACGWRA